MSVRSNIPMTQDKEGNWCVANRRIRDGSMGSWTPRVPIQRNNAPVDSVGTLIPEKRQSGPETTEADDGGLSERGDKGFAPAASSSLTTPKLTASPKDADTADDGSESSWESWESSPINTYDSKIAKASPETAVQPREHQDGKAKEEVAKLQASEETEAPKEEPLIHPRFSLENQREDFYRFVETGLMSERDKIAKWNSLAEEQELAQYYRNMRKD